MNFMFRGESVELTEKCIIFSDSKMIPTDYRFGFHHSTLRKFKVAKDEDLCHRYSFSAMKQLLCILYNERNCTSISTLIYALFPYDDDDDRQDALEIYEEIVSGTNNKLEELFNELLYMLNNSLINLRPGKSGWNRSIGMCYDPVKWEFTEEKGEKFIITDEIDTFILSNLLSINVRPSTIYFYSARNSAGKPILYSSNNSSENLGINKYTPCNTPIYIYPLDEDGNEFEMCIT